MSTKEPPGIAGKIVEALGSFWLSVTVLTFMFLLVVIGTLEQTRSSLFEVQKRYFESVFVLHEVAGIPIPLPGVYLLLVVLLVNLVVGGILRMRKDRSTWGVLITHVGIVIMLAGSAIEFTWSQKGHTTLAEGSDKAEFQSYYEWEIAVAEVKAAGPVDEFVVPGERFMHLSGDATATFTSPDLPFDLVVQRAFANCEPRDARAGEGVGGVVLNELARNKEAELDRAGAYVTFRPRNGGAPVPGALWANDRFSITASAEFEGRRYRAELWHRRWQLPFTVHLEEFRRDMHPGTGMAKAFESDVLKIRDGASQKVKISMNQPLRESGYTLYQSSFREPSAMTGGRWESTFSVVRNPADRVPLWSCMVITAGLLLHFGQKLVRHVKSQNRRRA